MENEGEVCCSWDCEIKRSVLVLFPESEPEGLDAFRKEHIHHPGRDIPFHATLVYEFCQIGCHEPAVLERLERVARETPRFQFHAIPLSAFPTSGTLYLNPSPVTELEALLDRLAEQFPELPCIGTAPHVWHMTVALGLESAQLEPVTRAYQASFGYAPVPLMAAALGICIQRADSWYVYKTIPLG